MAVSYSALNREIERLQRRVTQFDGGRDDERPRQIWHTEDNVVHLDMPEPPAAS